MSSYESMLRELTDDQALELALEVQQDIHRRDPLVKRLANKVVGDQKTIHELSLKALEVELEREKKILEGQLRLDAREEIERLHAAGQLKLYTPDESKKKIADIKTQELASFFAELEKAKAGTDTINIEIRGDVVTGQYQSHGRNVRMQHMCGMGGRERTEMVQVLKRLCGLV